MSKETVKIVLPPAKRILAAGSISLGFVQYVDWCNEQFGEKWRYEPGGQFVFEREEDAVLFALRWS